MITQNIIDSYAASHFDEAKDLLRTIGKIPAPSHDESRRAEYILEWLHSIGACEAYIDDALNVVFPFNIKENEKFSVIMAHTDIVFPDTEELPMHEEDGKIFAPGIGDDTANVAILLVGIRFLMENSIKPDKGILFVLNSCEEGLGNLDGCKQIFRDFDGRIENFVSLDGTPEDITQKAVGSARYKIDIQAEGGHSYGRFGNKSAIEQMANLICDLYKVTVPSKAKTTYNVGTISGGSTVNSIAEHCEILYEYRSEDRDCLSFMENKFNSIIESHRNNGIDVKVTTLGIRPCNGDIDENELLAFTEKAKTVLSKYSGKPVVYSPGSTDANIPLSLGIPGMTYGGYLGHGAHTRGEWVLLDSLLDGIKIVLETIFYVI